MSPDGERSRDEFRVVTAEPPSAAERYCAWYGDARHHVLYFGQAAFWSAMRAAGDSPLADLDREGPVPIGRFDLERERMLPTLELGAPGDRSGVWDVLPHANGLVYFTTLYESAGWVDPETGEGGRFAHLGPGLNEIAPGPGESLLFSRYAAGAGSVVIVDPDGTPRVEHALSSPVGYDTQPKTPAWDETRGWIWITTDMIPAADADPDARSRARGEGALHDAYVLDRGGRQVRRISDPLVQFVAFDADGAGYFAELRGRRLSLRVLPPEEADPDGGQVFVLTEDFPAAFDVVQDIRIAIDGRVVVTRWSGWVHVLEPGSGVRSVRLPSLDPPGLYYTAALRGPGKDRLCATHCGDVTVVCADLP